MPTYVNDNGTWREINESLSVHDGGSYREIDEGYVNDNGTWRLIYENITQVHTNTMIVTKGYPTVYGWSRSIIPFGMLTGGDSLIATNTNMGLGIGSGVYRPGDSQNLSIRGQFQPFPGVVDDLDPPPGSNIPKFEIQSNMLPGNSITGSTTWTDSVTNTSQEMHQLFWNTTQPSTAPSNVQGWAYITRKLNTTISNGGSASRSDLYICGASINKQNGTPIYMADKNAVNFRSGTQPDSDYTNWGFYTNSGGTFGGTAPLANNVLSNYFRQKMNQVHVYGDGGTDFITPGAGWYQTPEFDSLNAAYPGQNARFTMKLYGYPRWIDQNNVLRMCSGITWSTGNSVSMTMAADSSGLNNSNRSTCFKKIVFTNNDTNNKYTFDVVDSTVNITTQEDIFGNYQMTFDFGGLVTNSLGIEGTSVTTTIFI